MVKRKSLDIQKEIFNVIKKSPGITMTELERKVGTNPNSLRMHCEHLAHFNLIQIKKLKDTTKLY